MTCTSVKAFVVPSACILPSATRTNAYIDHTLPAWPPSHLANPVQYLPTHTTDATAVALDDAACAVVKRSQRFTMIQSESALVKPGEWDEGDE